jgi:hypothetical protein
MADKVKTFKVVLEGEGAKFEKTFESAGKAADDLGRKIRKLSDSEMGRLHDEALRMDRDFSATGKRLGSFADSVGRVSTTLARSADAFGLPTSALRTLDDVADVAELGFNNLSKSVAGFNAATLGIVGAGTAIGVAIGGFANRFESVRKFADDATRSLYDFLNANKLFGEASRDQGAGQFAGISQFSAAMAAKNEEAIRKQVAGLKAQGQTLEQIAAFYKGRLSPALQEELGITEKQIKVHKEATDAAKKTREEFAALVAQLKGEPAQVEVDKLAAAVNKLGVDGVADLEALRKKLEQLQQQGAKITDKNLLGILRGGKVEIPKELGNLDLGTELGDLDPAVLAQTQETFTSIALSAAQAGLSVEEIKAALDAAGASGGQLEVALAQIPVTFGGVFQETLAGLPNVILGAIQGGGDVGQAAGSFFGGSLLSGLTGEGGPLSKTNLSGVFGSVFGGALSSILPGLGSILGAGLGGLLDKLGGLFGDKTIMKVNDARDQFFAGWSNGFVGLQQDLVGTIGEVGQQDFVKQLFDAKTMEEFNAVVEKIREILASIGKDVPGVTIPVSYDVQGGPPIPAPPNIPELAAGAFVDMPTLALIGEAGPEWVIPDADMRSGAAGGTSIVVNANVNNNPLQTADTVREMNEHMIKLLQREVARDLPAAIAAGRA